MPRKDLLALTADDLITLTNRGTVKRALRELEAGTPACEFEEQDGRLRVTWSDGIVCEFPAGGSLVDAICSSGSTGISRHVVRAVLAYQAQCPAAEHQPAIIEPWDPGQISDGDLNRHFGKVAVTRARTRFKDGILAEVVRGPKPFARFLHEPCTVRFLVPGDLRYVYADCAERLMPTFVPLAVWAFRELPEGESAGLISIQKNALPIPAGVLDDIDRALADLCEHGIAGVTGVWRDRMNRLEERCRREGLVWPAELIADLVYQFQCYQEHDARFDPCDVAHFTGELAIRCNAIRNDTGAVPQLLIRGARSDTVTEIRSSRFIGLGCGVQVRRSSVQLSAFQQDIDSGHVTAVHRDFADPDAQSGEEPREFSALARTTVSRGMSLAALGRGQLLLKAGKRTPGHRLILPRGHVAVNPQAFEWEKLRAPVLAEGFAEIAARLGALPPSSLRPRRVAENLHVCPIRSVESVSFDAVAHCLRAQVRDARGDLATIVHPYTTRGRQGFERLAAHLARNGKDVQYISGHVRNGIAGLEFAPLCVVFKINQGMTALQPWIDAWEGPAAEFISSDVAEDGTSTPLDEVRAELLELLSESLITGLRRSVAGRWTALARKSEAVGFVRLAAVISNLARSLRQKAESRIWGPTEAITQLVSLAQLSRMGQDLN